MKRTITNMSALGIAILSICVNIFQAREIRVSGISLFWVLLVGFVACSILIALSVGPRNYLKQAYNLLYEETKSSFIQGEDEAIKALIAGVGRGKKHVRTSRYFPQPINRRHPEYIHALKKALDKNQLRDQLSRVISVNNPEKRHDIHDCIRLFAGNPATLYLTAYGHTFDMVIIDEEEAFMNFYGREKVISATLHLRNQEVVRRLIKLYDYLKDNSEDVVLPLKCSHLKTEDDIRRAINRADEFFDRHCPNSKS